MDGSDRELFPYLPYILQDIWEIGTDPKVIVNLIRKHFTNINTLRLLDVGCGKGAVSIPVAQQLGCSCFGIDAIPEFIDEANRKAKEFNVEGLCTFQVGDVREAITAVSVFDVIILGSIGPVFGNYFETMTTLSKHLTNTGLIIIDDSYIENGGEYRHPMMFSREELLHQIELSGMQLLDEEILHSDDVRQSSDFIFQHLKKRCLELIEQHPAKKMLFENYIKQQEEENEILEHRVVCSTMVLIASPRNALLSNNM
jgi:precorrin-6B methylase 2